MSNRTVDADLLAESSSSIFRSVLFAKLAFPSGTVFVHNSVGTYKFGGDTYLGVGTFGSIDPITDTLGMANRPVVLSLSSVNDEIIQAVRDDDILGRDADLYLGVMDENMRLKGTPENWWSGYMEAPSLSVGDENAVKLSLQSRASRLKEKNGKRYTVEEHQAEYAGDLFLEFLPYVQEASVAWAGEHVRTGFQNTTGLQPETGGGRGGGGRRTGPGGTRGR